MCVYMVVKLAALCHMYTPFRSRHLLCFLFYAWILTDVIWKSINTYWMAYTVQICHLDLQSFAHWLPAISFWHLATSWTYEVSALIQFSSVAHHKLTFGSRAFRFSDPRVWNLLPVSIRETKSLPILFSVSPSPSNCQSCPEYIRPRAVILLKTLALYKPFTY